MVSVKDLEDSLKEKLIPFIESQDLRVFELKVFCAQGKLCLRVLVDFKEGGISLGDCGLVSRKISDYLDESNLIDSPFTLEVFSPGLDRELKTPQDFLRVKDKQVCLWLDQELDGKSYYQAKISEIDPEERIVFLEIDKQTVSIPFSMIRKAIPAAVKM